MTDESDEPVLTGLQRSKADVRSTHELIAIALYGFYREFVYPDEDVDHSALGALQDRGTREVLDAALVLCDAENPLERELGVQILRELGRPERTFPEECADRLLRFLREEVDIEVLTAAVYAFSHLGSRRGDLELIKFKDHAEKRIRRGVAFSLAGTTHPDAVQALLHLMRDPYEGARDWATTSIGGVVEIDGPEIREALLERAADEDMCTRAEAHMGLARRRDERVLPFLIAILKEQINPSDEDRHTGADYCFHDAAKILLDIANEEDIPVQSLVTALERLVSKRLEPPG